LDVVRDILPNWRRWEGLFAYFKPSQVEKIDFSTHPMNQRMFDARYPKPDTSKRDWYRNNPIQELSGPQIVASQFLFDEERASCISPEQVADMVFSRLTPEPLLKGMFKERCPSQAQYHRLYKVKPEQYAYVEKYLTEGMKQAYTENVLNKK
jgi:hypothetical protein